MRAFEDPSRHEDPNPMPDKVEQLKPQGMCDISGFGVIAHARNHRGWGGLKVDPVRNTPLFATASRLGTALDANLSEYGRRVCGRPAHGKEARCTLERRPRCAAFARSLATAPQDGETPLPERGS
jgi:hypothetical protein